MHYSMIIPYPTSKIKLHFLYFDTRTVPAIFEIFIKEVQIVLWVEVNEPLKVQTSCPFHQRVSVDNPIIHNIRHSLPDHHRYRTNK